jgi:SAM-dependent methyltransferase
MLYEWKVHLLKRPFGNRIWRRWVSQHGRAVGDYGDLRRHVERFAPGRSFADIGCMWGVNGEYAFLAERAGAGRVVGVDVFGPTPEFEARRVRESSRVEFVLGDIVSQGTIERVGEVDLVLCAGVLYHHPSPLDLLVALRRICRETLILRTATIPEEAFAQTFVCDAVAPPFHHMLPSTNGARQIGAEVSATGVARPA